MKRQIPPTLMVISLLILCVVVFTLTGFSKRAQVEIYIEDLENDTLFLEINSLTQAFSEPLQETLVAHEGYLQYILPVEDTVQLSITPISRQVKGRNGHTFNPVEHSIELFLLPNSKATVDGQAYPDRITYTVTGSTLNQEYAEFRDQQLADRVAWREIDIQYRRLTMTPGFEEAMRLSILARMGQYDGEVPAIADSSSRQWRKMKAIKDRLRLQEIDYILTQGDQELAGWLLAKQPMDTLAKYHERLSAEVAEGMFKHLINYQYDYLQTQDRPDRELKVAVGDLAPTFQVLLPGQEPYMFGPIPGKYIVLDFWGSFCKPCIDEFPKLKEYYSEYGEQLEIIGLPVDSRYRWQRIVDREELPWPNIFPVSENFQNKAKELYNVTTFPTKIIIDTKGAVVGIHVGARESFYKQLDALLGVATAQVED